MKRVLITAIFIFSLIQPLFGQYNYAEEILQKQTQTVTKTDVVKLDLGIGLGIAGSGGGISLRMAPGFNINNWGGTFRMMLATGETGRYVNGIIFGNYYLRERFYERAFLLNRVLKNYSRSHLTAGVGIGSVRGNRLSDDGSSEIDFDKVYGFAFEVNWETAGKVFGGSSQIYGNINNEAIFIGVSFCMTLGVWWD